MSEQTATFITRYTLLRGLNPSCTISYEVAEEPRYVLTLLDETKFLATDGLASHNETVLYEDRLHDWEWFDGKFRYYPRRSNDATAILVYEDRQATRAVVMNFCPYCGTRIADAPGHDVVTPHGPDSVGMAKSKLGG